MKLELQYTYEDYREANHAHLSPRTTGRRVWIALIFAGMIACLVWAIIRPMHPAAMIPTTAPTSFADAFNPLLVFAPWLFILFLVVMVVGMKSVTTQRIFIQMTSGRSRVFSTPFLIIGGIVLAGSVMVISTAREPAPALGSPSSSNSDGGVLIWIPWVAVIVIVCVAVLRGAYRKNWKLQPSLARPRTIEYSAKSVSSDDGLTMVSYRWEAFLRCIETRNMFLLYPSGLGFVMVPKRAFPSTDAVDGFRQLIQEWADGRRRGISGDSIDTTTNVIRPTTHLARREHTRINVVDSCVSSARKTGLGVIH